ncbi:phage tail tape measure C-terminal domain-containing protein [Azospirillum sp.]|uniref:phage tail tape measure C-terminal domain-containing protein n=1 Tax=Azospirillum sp. TaxID=34012 RepID=UPI003D748B49
MTAYKVRLELELVDGSFKTRLSQLGQSIKGFERNVKPTLDAFAVFLDAAGKSGNALRKLSSQADDVLGKMEKVRKATADLKSVAANPAAADTPPSAGDGKKAAAPANAGEKAPDSKAIGFDELLRSWGDTNARLKKESGAWLTDISAELSKQLVTGKSNWNKVRTTALTGLVQIELQAVMSQLFSGGLFGWIDKGLKLLPDAIGNLFGWLTGDTGGKGTAAATGSNAPVVQAAAATSAATEQPAGTGKEAAAQPAGGGDTAKDKNKQSFDDLMSDWGNTTKNLKEKGAGWLTDLSARLSTLVVTGKAKFGDLTKTILTGLVEIEIKAMMSKVFSGGLFDWIDKGLKVIPDATGGLFSWISKGLSWLTGFATGGGGLATTPGWENFTGAYHSGGIAGLEPTFSRLVPAGLFANARKFHTGGFPGLRSDEVPAILRKGEGVFTPEQMASLGGQVVNQTVNVNLTAAGGTPQQNSDLAERIGRQVQEQLRGMVAGEIRQQMRPGGMLAA